MKNCKKCGCENNDDYIYCINCGTPLNEDVSLKEDTIKEKSIIEKLPKKYVTIGIIVLAIVSILVFAISSFSNSKSSKTFGIKSNPISILNQNGFVYGLNDGKITDKVEIDLDYSNCSLDCGIIVFFDDDYNLYFYNGNTIDKIDEDVYDFSISQDGKKIAYSLDNGLYVFDTKDKKSKQIFEGYIDSFKISPNGEYLAFLSETDMYIYDGTNTKIVDITDVLTIVAINNKQEVFYTDIDDSLYIVNQNEETTQIDSYVASVRFNRDMTECIVFSNDGGQAYKDGKVLHINGFDVEDNIDEIICPTASNLVIYQDYGIEIYQHDIDSFSNKYYLTYNKSLIKIDSSFHVKEVIYEGVDEFCTSLNGNTIYFLADGSLYIYDCTSVELLEDNVDELYDCDLDGKGAYYISNDRIVSYVDSSKNVKTLGEYDVYSHAINKDNYFIFFDLTSKNAIASKSGNETITLVEEEASNIDLCISYDVSYFVYDDELFYVKDNCKVENINFE